ncbi:MAG: ABC transporter permease [Streptosporangiaceae bacterium]|nr:ABC transporter permease [Streptosporangiaceae bacterium]
MALGTGVTAPETTPVSPAAAGGRRRFRLPRSPKIIVGLVLLGIFVLIAFIGPLIAPYNPSATLSTASGTPQPPSAAHWLGTTQIQQDVLSQLLVGTRATMVVSFLAGAVATVLSILIGVSAGYFGGLTDDLLSMLINVGLVLPALPLLIVLTGFLSSSTSANDLLIALIIAVTGWAFGARVLRVQTLSLRNRDFVDSARLIGERSWRIVVFEILPSLIPIVATSFLFTVIYAIGTYTSLAFLGLISGSHWSWGTMLFWAQQSSAAQSKEWWWFVPPGLAVALLGMSLALLNFGIDEFINPRLRAAGLSRKIARQAGLPRRFRLGVTPVTRSALAGRPAPVPAATASSAAASATTGTATPSEAGR